MLATATHRSSEDCSANSMKANKDMDNVVDPEAGDGQSEDTEEEKVYKVSLNVIPIFILEVLSMACLCVLAYYLRFENKFPVVIRGFRCHDPTISLPRYPDYGNHSAPLNIRHQVLYGVSIGVPVALVILGELGRCLFSTTNKKVVRAGCVSCKLHLVTRRIVRIGGGFIFGFLCTSIVTDSLKLATGCLRPYFLEVCDVKPNYCDSVSTTSLSFTLYQYLPPRMGACMTPEEELRDARTSFPSYHASLSAYSGLFIMIYVNQVLIIRASRLLRPWLVIAVGCLVLLCGTSRVVLHRSHWHDVVAGFAIGSVIAIYMSSSVLKFFLEYYQWHRRQCCNRGNKHSPRPLFFRYFHIPRVSYQNKSGQSYPSNGQDGYGYSPRNRATVNEAFRKDLHQRIEDYGRRRGFQKES